MGGGVCHEDPASQLHKAENPNAMPPNAVQSNHEINVIGEQENKAIDSTLNNLIKRPNQPPSHFKPTTRVSVPSTPVYQSARRLLSNRLRTYDVVEYQIKGDGSCQFASLSDQLFRNLSKTDELRREAIQQLRQKPEYYIEFVYDTSYHQYCTNMSKSKTWGDHLTLQALADRLHIVINLLTSYQNTPHVEIKPRGNVQVKRHVWLSFFGEVHYNSLYPSSRIQARLSADKTCVIC